MARNEKLEVRDMDAQDEKGYLTKSRAQVDLERRTEDGYVPDSNLGSTATVNPNPFGAEEYVGTDPIYQNYANDQNKPLAAEEGVEAEVLEAYKDEHEVDESVEVTDPGLGGTAAKVPAGTGGATFRTILPGQDGYDRQKAEEQNGPPLRVYNDEELDTSSDESGDDETGEVGPVVQPPATPAAPQVQNDEGDNSNKANEGK